MHVILFRWGLGVFLLVSLNSASGFTAGTFLEKEGVVVMEAEAETPQGGWKSETQFTGYTGKSYYCMTGNTPAGGSPNGRLSYRLKISTPGTYHLRLHGIKKNLDGDSTHANDCYTKLVNHPGFQGTDTKTYLAGAMEQWSWKTDHESGQYEKYKGPAKYELGAGEHELQISGRSKGYCFDRIVLYRDGVSEAEATSLNRPESPIDGGSANPDSTQPGQSSGPGGERVLMKAIEFPVGGFYRDKEWLAVQPSSSPISAKTSLPFAGKGGSYQITFQAVGESDGRSLFRLVIAGKKVGEFRPPLSTQPYEVGAQYAQIWKDIPVAAKADIEVFAETASADGQEWARARWQQIEFVSVAGSGNDPGGGNANTGNAGEQPANAADGIGTQPSENSDPPRQSPPAGQATGVSQSGELDGVTGGCSNASGSSMSLFWIGLLCTILLRRALRALIRAKGRKSEDCGIS